MAFVLLRLARSRLWRSKSLLRLARSRLLRSKSLLRLARSRLWRSILMFRLPQNRLWRSNSRLGPAWRCLWRSTSLRSHCSKSLVSVTLSAVPLHAVLHCSVHGYARVCTSIYIFMTTARPTFSNTRCRATLQRQDSQKDAGNS